MVVKSVVFNFNYKKFPRDRLIYIRALQKQD